MNEENNPTENSKDPQKEPKDISPDLWSAMVVGAIKYFFKNIWAFASSLIAFLGILYFMGWATSVGYFSKFGASWLTSSQSLIQILEFSRIPLVYLFWLLFFALVDIFEYIHIPKHLFFFKHIWKILFIVAGVSLTVYGVNSYFYKLPFWATSLADFMWAGLWLVFVVQMLKEIIFLKLRESKYLEEQLLRSVFVFGAIGCFWFPYKVGNIMGAPDSSFDRSRIPYVKIKSSEDKKQSRFLFKSETHVYAVKFTESGPPYRIKIIPIDQVEYIEPYSKKDDRSKPKERK